jgi:hypothetical protein
LFYGSFFLAAATILYSLFSPDEIKRYASAFEMADGETKHQMNLGQFSTVQNSLKTLYENLSNWESSVLSATIPVFDPDPSPATNRVAVLSGYFIRQWTIRNLQRRVMRIIIYLLFAAGLSLLALPAIFTFLQVTWLAVTRPFT